MSELYVEKIGRNLVKQKNGEQAFSNKEDVVNSWQDALVMREALGDIAGFRSAQLGALCSIKAHWTTSNYPATIVMPTGTGKTETMMATIVLEKIKTTLIIVPSKLLRDQTTNKFVSLGILKEIGVVQNHAQFPIVATLQTTPQDASDLIAIFEKANVIITTMSLLKYFPETYFDVIREKVDTVIVDEAHHVAAKVWATVKSNLSNIRCIQFTATPFRNDGKKVDGKIIYNFPLALAQKQGYFQPIKFDPIWEYDETKADFEIAKKAIEQLESDLAKGYNHIVLVRCKDKKSADALYNDVYSQCYNQYNPVLIHSDKSKREIDTGIKQLKEGTSKIVVCVDMFGEGIDIPNLKIAAMHDKYKSLPITLQFVGRFARTAHGLGEATFITNIANDELNNALQDLYAQDADWNAMLHMLSKTEIEKEVELQDLAEGFDSPLFDNVSIQQLRPKVSMTAYEVKEKNWMPSRLRTLFVDDNCDISINEDQNVIVIAEKVSEKAEWTSYKGAMQTNWELHVIYWNSQTGMLYVNSTVKGISDEIATALFPSAVRVKGERVFKSLYGINRLMLGTVGLKSAIDGPIRYKMFAGIDVGNGIAESQKSTSTKSNLFGVGFCQGERTSIGCSYKGRIWSRWVESISFWMKWCDNIGVRLNDTSIDTSKIFEGALIPEIVEDRPNAIPYSIEWPVEFDNLNEESVMVKYQNKEVCLYDLDIALESNNEAGPIRFYIGDSEWRVYYEFSFIDAKPIYRQIGDDLITLKKGRKSINFTDFLNEHPPLVRFCDQSSLEGNVLVKVSRRDASFDSQKITKWDWNGIDIKKESQTAQKFVDSIQYRVIQHLKGLEKYDVIFDDDDSGEIADVVCIESKDNSINIDLFHCKFSRENEPGTRIADLYEVCGQAEKSIKWCADYKQIIDHMKRRELVSRGGRDTRIEVGSLPKIMEIKNRMRALPVKMSITIVQPGVDSKNISSDMATLLNGTASYLSETYGIELELICS